LNRQDAKAAKKKQEKLIALTRNIRSIAIVADH
jgi:hypothetical protein